MAAANMVYRQLPASQLQCLWERLLSLVSTMQSGGRLYIDYYAFGDKSSQTPRRRALALKKVPNPATALARTVISDTQQEDEQTIDSDAASPGVAQTTGEFFATPDEPSSPQTVIHEFQLDLLPEESTKSILKSTEQNLGVAASGGTRSPRLDVRDGYDSPPARSQPTIQPLAHYNPQPEEDQHQAKDVSRRFTPKNDGFDGKMPDFFSPAIFRVVLRDPAIAHQLLKFSESRLCGESIWFLARVNKYYAKVHEVSTAMAEIHKDFLGQNASSQIHLSEHTYSTLSTEMRSALSLSLPKLESVFADAILDVENRVHLDVYPKFIQHQMSVSAAKALGGDRARYAGLGDCFVLTDPSKADNPIVFASDGFVKVTGYHRKEIIPRNCRFLQSELTDRLAVKRIKDALDKREESVELFLNQKKDGEPFWNLLYISLLFDSRGRLAFFLGGQINCSTTVHSTSDVLRILAQSSSVDEDTETHQSSSTTIKAPQIRSIRRQFRTNSASSVQQRAPGMENGLIDRIGHMSLKDQSRTFYTAYSNVRPPSLVSSLTKLTL